MAADLIPRFQAEAENAARLAEVRRTEQAAIAQEKAVLTRRIAGIREYGFVGYLARVDASERHTMIELAKQTAATASPSVPAETQECRTDLMAPTDERARHRAEQARKRRKKNRSKPQTEEQRNQKKCRLVRRADLRRRQREFERQNATTRIPSIAAIHPHRRQHEERIALLEPDQQRSYQNVLDRSRTWGREAALCEADLLKAIPSSGYRSPHEAVAVGQDAFLIAVRGGTSSDQARLLSGTDPRTIMAWLAEPGIQRNAKKGKRGRLKHLAGHITVGWSSDIHALARSEALMPAVAHQVDLLVARSGLQGHRVAAYLHLDSASGHVHLHVVFSRIRDDDLSLWSIEGRDRAMLFT